MKRLFLAYVFTCVIANIVWAFQVDSAGTISGIVVDDRAQPVVGARVIATLADGRPRAKLLTHVETDKNGQFLLEHLAWGLYRVHAMKEEDGHPNTYWSFYSKGFVTPTARLSAQQSQAQVLIVLAQKTAAITGSITDAVTGAPLNATIRMQHVKDSNTLFSASAEPQYKFLIPANTGVELAVAAPGYEDWYYPDGAQSSSGRPLLLQPGEKATIDIKLRPKAQ
jgi:hypothetical protein